MSKTDCSSKHTRTQKISHPSSTRKHYTLNASKTRPSGTHIRQATDSRLTTLLCTLAKMQAVRLTIVPCKKWASLATGRAAPIVKRRYMPLTSVWQMSAEGTHGWTRRYVHRCTNTCKSALKKRLWNKNTTCLLAKKTQSSNSRQRQSSKKAKLKKRQEPAFMCDSDLNDSQTLTKFALRSF